MKIRSRIGLASAVISMIAAGLGAGVFIYARCHREPSYLGKTTAEWFVHILHDVRANNPSSDQSIAAFRTLDGAAVPFLSEMWMDQSTPSHGWFEKAITARLPAPIQQFCTKHFNRSSIVINKDAAQLRACIRASQALSETNRQTLANVVVPALLAKAANDPEFAGGNGMYFGMNPLPARLNEAARILRPSPDAIVHRATSLLLHTNVAVAASAGRILWHCGEFAAPATRNLICLLKSSDSERRSLAISVLRAIGPKAIEAGPTLESLMDDPACGINAVYAVWDVERNTNAMLKRLPAQLLLPAGVQQAMHILDEIGPPAKSVCIQFLSGAIEQTVADNKAGNCLECCRMLWRMDSTKGDQIANALATILSQRGLNGGQLSAILRLLRQMGQQAKPAIPAIVELLDATPMMKLSEELKLTLRAIQN